ncbi:MAG: HEAT repeat domain-containing protein, partial [Phycisphaerales bacterium]
ACTEPKLGSPNNRVRANAVKSLLRTELRRAGKVLLDMLEDPSPATRLSALWVIERMQSRAALNRVGDMSRADPDERVRRRAKRVWNLMPLERTTRSQSFEAAPKEAQASP